MPRNLIAALLFLLTCAVVDGDTLVLKDGRQYTGIVVKTHGRYTVYVGKQQFNVDQSDVLQWIKGDVRPETSIVKPKPRAATRSSSPSDARNIATLKRRGNDALAAGAYRVARNAFFDLLLIDSNNSDGLEGEGLAYLGMGDAARGRQLLEAGLNVAGASSRSLALNTALADVRTKNPVRAAKIIRDLLVETKAEDTRALDLMLFALGECDAQAQENHVFGQLQTFAREYEAKLQSAHPGLRRWGSEWLTPDEVKQKEQEQKADNARVAPVERELDDRNQAVAAANKELAKLQMNQIHGVTGLERAMDKQRRLLDQLQAAAHETEMRLAALKTTATSATASALALEPMLPVEAPIAVAINTPGPSAPDPVAVAPSPPTPAPATPPAVTPAAVPASSEQPAAESPRRRMVVDDAAGFAVGPDLIVTDALAIEGATTIKVQSPDGVPMEATLVRKDDPSGLALLRVTAKLNYVIIDDRFAGGAIKCVSFPRVSLFDPAAETIPGTAVAPVPDWFARLDRHPRLGGGPLISAGGQVVGVELATRDAPLGQIRAASGKDLIHLLGADAAPTAGSARATDAIFEITATHEK
jgi:hypothetical protein